MRSIVARCLFVALLAALAAGPVLAAPLVRSGPSLAAPAAAGGSPLTVAWHVLTFGVLALGTTITVKDTAKIASKYVTRAGAAAGDYKDGVSNAGSKWEANTKGAEASYDAGVQQAIQRKAFGKGVNGQAGKFQNNAVNLGSVRYAPGVQNAQDAYTRGVGPYLDRLKSLDLPPRGPRRSPQNQQRSTAVQLALAALKTGS